MSKINIDDYTCYTFGQLVIMTDQHNKFAAVAVVASAGQQHQGHGMLYELAGPRRVWAREARFNRNP